MWLLLSLAGLWSHPLRTFKAVPGHSFRNSSITFCYNLDENVIEFLAETLEEHDRNLYKMPASYRRMVRMAREVAESEPLELISKGGFRPVMPEEAKHGLQSRSSE